LVGQFAYDPGAEPKTPNGTEPKRNSVLVGPKFDIKGL